MKLVVVLTLEIIIICVVISKSSDGSKKINKLETSWFIAVPITCDFCKEHHKLAPSLDLSFLCFLFQSDSRKGIVKGKMFSGENCSGRLYLHVHIWCWDFSG